MKTNAQKAHNITRRRKGKVVKREGGSETRQQRAIFCSRFKVAGIGAQIGEKRGKTEEEKERNIAFSNTIHPHCKVQCFGSRLSTYIHR